MLFTPSPDQADRALRMTRILIKKARRRVGALDGEKVLAAAFKKASTLNDPTARALSVWAVRAADLVMRDRASDAKEAISLVGPRLIAA